EGMEEGVFAPYRRKIRRIRAGSGPYALSPDPGRTRIKNSKEGCRIHDIKKNHYIVIPHWVYNELRT
ncbi:hypothetical protein, partial [Methanomethylophilus alvi]|uniref:hypothetical protein n=1 Tax=Methanomethylophilus alvi TaxID=1291540 RepID=UPI0037DCFA2F